MAVTNIPAAWKLELRRLGGASTWLTPGADVASMPRPANSCRLLYFRNPNMVVYDIRLNLSVIDSVPIAR